MEHTFKEIFSLIKNGPIAGKEKTFCEVLDIVLSCTQEEDAQIYFSEDFLSALLKFQETDLVYSALVYKILINIYALDGVSERLCTNGLMQRIINRSLCDIANECSDEADASCMLISNITRIHSNCEKILILLSPLTECLSKIVSIFTNLHYNSKCTLDQLAMVLCNLSQSTEVREILTQSDNNFMQSLVPFLSHENPIRRRGIISVVHNCAFDSRKHSLMLSKEVDLLPRLLLPLAGPEEFDEEDNEKLPVDLQYLPDTKTRESDPEIRKMLLETLNQLCATKFGRQFLRDHNTYIVLRELHKWEENSSVLLACENVVDILIKTEDEIGFDQLKSIDIPTDLADKFNKECNS